MFFYYLDIVYIYWKHSKEFNYQKWFFIKK